MLRENLSSTPVEARRRRPRISERSSWNGSTVSSQANLRAEGHVVPNLSGLAYRVHIVTATSKQTQ